MERGRVKSYGRTRGFGFIIPDGGGKDVFMHAQELQNGEPLPGDLVEYELGPNRKTGREEAKFVTVIV